MPLILVNAGYDDDDDDDDLLGFPAFPRSDAPTVEHEQMIENANSIRQNNPSCGANLRFFQVCGCGSSSMF